jgi:type II secretory pathway pseudopilin PulG
MKQRHGSTLLEVVIAIPISFALLIGAIGLVHKAMMVSNFAKNQSLARRTIGNLAQQFRTDVHKSASAQLERDERSNKFRLLLSHPNRNTVIYESDDSVIRRIAGDVQQEQFLISGNRDAKVEIFDVTGRTISRSMKRIRLTIMRPTEGHRKNDESNGLADAEIEATLGVFASARTGKESHE